VQFIRSLCAGESLKC